MHGTILKFFIIFSFLNLFSNIYCKTDENFRAGTRFKALKCESNSSIVQIKFCYLKPVSRQVVTLNVGVKILVEINKPAYVQLVLNYRYGTIFRQVLDTHLIEWCGIMDGSATHPWLALVIDQLKGTAPALFHKCPYFGDLDVNNVTIDRQKNNQKSSMFPEGTYRGELSYAKDGIQIFKASLSFELKSALKESFG